MSEINFLNAYGVKGKSKNWFCRRYFFYVILIILIFTIGLLFMLNKRSSLSVVSNIQKQPKKKISIKRQNILFPKENFSSLSLFGVVLSPGKHWALVGSAQNNILVIKVNDHLAKENYLVQKITEKQIFLLNQKTKQAILMGM